MFTVLMSVYARENPTSLDAALASLANQTLPAPEIVLVKDGPLTTELEAVIDKHLRALPLKVVPLKANVGLAQVLNIGMRTVSQDWIVRFDSDDICIPERLEAQQAWMQKGTLDLFGSQILEFDHDPAHTKQSRQVPCEHDTIQRFSARRNPFNHMSVCFRRDLVLKLGGYPEIPLMEDYALWLKLLHAGARTANDPRPWVAARVGNGMLQRRGGWRYVRSECQLQRLMLTLKQKPLWRAVLDGSLRSAVFLAPSSVRAMVYSKVLRQPPASR